MSEFIATHYLPVKVDEGAKPKGNNAAVIQIDGWPHSVEIYTGCLIRACKRVEMPTRGDEKQIFNLSRCMRDSYLFVDKSPMPDYIKPQAREIISAQFHALGLCLGNLELIARRGEHKESGD